MKNEQDISAFELDAIQLKRLVEAIADRIDGGMPGLQEARRLVEAAERKRQGLTLSEAWPILRLVYQEGLTELLSRNDLPLVSYNIDAPLSLESPPMGFDHSAYDIALPNEPNEFAGIPIAFPIGMPASVLAANAKWIRFYAERGFCVLTYKTVRSCFRRHHPYPNWVFIQDPRQVREPSAEELTGQVGLWPNSLSKVTMANSFGVPSFAPDWWQRDVRLAKKSIRRGQQVLIVSVMASVHDSIETIEEDFAHTAVLAAQAGADIVEANFSCPNVVGDPIGLLYSSPESSGRVAKAIRERLDSVLGVNAPPLLIKIGYLNAHALGELIESVYDYIDGITAINTIPAKIVDSNNKQTFPDSLSPYDRATAGVSGWAIQEAAMEVIANIAIERDRLFERKGKRLTLFGVGGVSTLSDYAAYRSLGADAVGTCTAAFLNPYFAMEVRSNQPTDQLQQASPGWLRREIDELLSFAREVYGIGSK